MPTQQKTKKKYGLLPPKEAKTTPQDKLCVDLIGPYKIRRKGEKELICRCVTMIVLDGQVTDAQKGDIREETSK
jgi:hypothetical protein